MSTLISKGPADLVREVISQDKCTTCGLCVGMCPYIKTAGERVSVIHPCGLNDGNCYKICPRTPTKVDLLDQYVFGEERKDHIFGKHLDIVFARALDNSIASRGQYGGVVSALVSFALREGAISGAVLTKKAKESVYPQPVLASTKKDVLECAGSKYSASPTLAMLNKAVQDGEQRIGVVCRPCQVTALRKMQVLATDTSGHNLSASKVELIIGLFCFWSFSPDFYKFLAANLDTDKIIKMDITTEELVVYMEDGEMKWPLNDIRKFIKPTCLECFDSTSELADLSVGSTEYDAQWNTLLIRTDQGKTLVNQAVDSRVLEIKPYPAERISILQQAVLNKKLRVLAAQKENGVADYLQLSENYRLILST